MPKTRSVPKNTLPLINNPHAPKTPISPKTASFPVSGLFTPILKNKKQIKEKKKIIHIFIPSYYLLSGGGDYRVFKTGLNAYP
jgi:hypothetical protein